MTHEQRKLDGKVVVITGALGILGKHFARAFAHANAAVAVIDLDPASCESFAEELAKESGARTLGIACDITNPEQVKHAIEQVVSSFGAMHVLHNNAASKSSDLSAFFASFEDYSLQTWREVMSVNIDGMFLMAQAAAKQMKKQGAGGSIIQTGSIYGVAAPDQRIYEQSQYLGREINSPAVYSASKGAVVALTKYLAAYLAPHAIRVNTLSPGGIESGQNEIFTKKYSARVPLGRMGRPEELLGALLFLASDESSYFTGQNLVVDGGLTCW